MDKEKKKEYCEEHPAIELVWVKEGNGLITLRCAICDFEKL